MAKDAPAPEINPSTTIGIFFAAAPIIRPRIPPISNPPTLVRISIGSSGLGLCISSACFTTDIFFAKVVSSIPVPRPVT